MNELEDDATPQIYQPGGYVFQLERHDELALGQEPIVLAKTFSDTFPEMNVQADPLDVLTLEDQLQIGACVGNSGTSVVEGCYFMATGRKIQLSRACGYYQAQREDGIRGDSGATLAGFRTVATTKGLCLESDWPYPSRYDNRIPSTATGKFDYKVSATRPIKTIDEFDFWIKEKKLPIHGGLIWNNTTDREYVTSYSGSGMGGHAIMFWQMVGEDYRMINSWNKWRGKGWNRWSRKAIIDLLRDNNTVLIGYAPDEMSFPTPVPIGL